MSAPLQHGFRCASSGIGGETVTCVCGFMTALHATRAAATDEWRTHAGLPPIRSDLHPVWCDDLHEQEPCATHLGSFGQLPLADDAHVTAVLEDTGPDRGLVVTVTVLTRTAEVDYPVAIEPAPRPGKRTRRQHAFTVERTAGDHHVWTCSCGDWTRAHDPGDDITSDLIEHALGDAR